MVSSSDDRCSSNGASPPEDLTASMVYAAATAPFPAARHLVEG
jgi:hypothetical protein